MNRRNFLSLAFGAVAASAATRVWPFRVYSIPKEITTFGGLQICPYPGRLSTPLVGDPSACLTPELLRQQVDAFEHRLFGIPANDPTWGASAGPYMGLSRAITPGVYFKPLVRTTLRLPSSES